MLSGELPAGRRLSQEALADQYAVSRVPIRDALRMLNAEGLISTHPRFGTMVAPLSAVDLDELYEMRLALEPLVVRLATPHIRRRDLEEMDVRLATMRQADKNTTAWFTAHAAFHRALNERSGRHRICTLVDSLRAQTERYVRAYQLLEFPASDLEKEHQAILDMVRGGDPDEAAEVIRHHLVIVRDRMLDHLRAGEAEEAVS